jgi:hypothetical protein
MNQLAGSLLYVLPVALAALVAPAHGQDERLGSGWRIILCLGGLMSASLVLAQSRAAWLGLVFAILSFWRCAGPGGAGSHWCWYCWHWEVGSWSGASALAPHSSIC